VVVAKGGKTQGTPASGSTHRGGRGRTLRWARLAGLAGLLALAAGMLPGIPAASAATTPTVVSLTFDNGTVSQYSLGYQQALQPHGVNATFYVNSGTVGRSTTMSWAQLGTLAAAGSEIGGKTVDGTNLTTLTAQQQIAEICNDRQALLQHGLKPFSFAYPGGAGASNTTIQSEVQGCGYGNARSAGSLAPAGPTYAETLPPKSWLSLRAYAPSGQVTLANLESLVSGAVSHGGGWGPDRHRQGVLAEPGPGQLQHLHHLVGVDRPGRPQHVPHLGAKCRAVGRRAGRGGVQHDRGRSHVGRYGRARDHDRL
jgi:peptidoglycan/xylan/chitin deacetylase (PgdA/CDA1 family)